MRGSKRLAMGVVMALVTVVTVVPLAMAAEIEGKVQSVDMNARAITLDDGTKLKIANVAQLQDIKPGVSVKASYVDRGGEKVATSIRVAKGGPSMPGTGGPASTPQRTQ